MINRWALLAENFIHTKASGLDNTICTYGTMVQYTKLNSHKLLEAPELKILLIYSGLICNLFINQLYIFKPIIGILYFITFDINP